MRVIVFAYHEMGAACLEVLLASGVEVARVYTHADRPGENHWFRSVAELAAARRVPVFMPDEINESRWIKDLRELHPDLFLSLHYRQILNSELLGLPRLGGVNIHASLLPRFRGRCPVNWTLLHGASVTGVTLHRMMAKPDAGDILAQCRVPIDPDDTALDLHRRLAAAGACLLQKALPDLAAGHLQGLPQHDPAATTFGRRRAEDGRIDWSAAAFRIHDLVRAVTYPYPGAFTHACGRKLFIWATGYEPAGARHAQAGVPGEIRIEAGQVGIGTGDGWLLLRRAQFEGEEILAGADLSGRLGGLLTVAADSVIQVPGPQAGHLPDRR